MKGVGLGGGIAVLRVSVSHIIGGGSPLKLVPPTSAFISGTPGKGKKDKRSINENLQCFIC